MRNVIILLLTLSFAGTAIVISCKKEYSCENCANNSSSQNSNKPPIAVAGPDQVITLPTDSVSLDGSSSHDPDGNIREWFWRRISGPASFNIINASTAKTVVKNLTTGTYQFELKVTDNGGLFAKDTMRVFVSDPSNHPPIANAGADQVITLPINTVNLDGGASTDPENNIASYMWSKISGPSLFNVENTNAVQTRVTNLISGTYKFELRVTDAGGLFSIDTTIITVNAASSSSRCDNSDRPVVNAQLIPFGTLSHARLGMAVATAGSKILFAGASLSAVNDSPIPQYGSSRVDIYDTATRTWSIAELSKSREDIGAISLGNKIFFAGGRLGDGAIDELFSTVDIYDVSDNTWTVASLSEPRAYISAAAVGNKVFFAGGEKDWNYNTSATVDIYDLSTNSWSTTTLGGGRAYISAVTVNNKIYFAGGHAEDRWYSSPSDRIDIYNDLTNSWSTSSLKQPMGSPAAIAVGQNIYWAEGCNVEVKNINTGSSSFANLFIRGSWIIDEGQNAVMKDDKIIFLRHKFPEGADKFDIYNMATNTWSIGALPQAMPTGASVISVNNTIYVAGGSVNGVLSNQVWKLEF